MHFYGTIKEYYKNISIRNFREMFNHMPKYTSVFFSCWLSHTRKRGRASLNFFVIVLRFVMFFWFFLRNLIVLSLGEKIDQWRIPPIVSISKFKTYID